MSSDAEISQLEKILDDADNMYYNFGDSDLSDEEYDNMRDRLYALDKKNKRFKDGKNQRSSVGAKVTKKKEKEQWKKVTHNYKMGSQAKITDKEGLLKWAEQHSDSPRWLVQDKLDGISIRLEYKNGKLVEAVTRGDGSEGEDILRNVLKMEGVPASVSVDRDLTVRGEIILLKSNMEQFPGAKTARNTAAGTAKRLDGSGCDWLNVKVYDVQNWKDFGFKKVSSSLQFLKDNGFDVVKSKIVSKLDEVQERFDEYVDSIREDLDWDIDGLVIKTGLFGDDDWAIPTRSVAYKFPSKRAVTKLVDVVWQDTGGRICPVGHLEPTDVDGVTISKATLNNVEHIKKLGIKIGDTVEISRRNDVIPCIEKVMISASDGKDIVPPEKDDEGYDIVHEKNAEGKELVYLVTTNPNSKSRRVRRIVKWFANHGAKGVASATVEAVIDSGIAYDLPDFYDICINGHDDLMDIEGFGPGTYKIMKQAALKTSQTDVLTFLDALDFNGFGKRTLDSIISTQASSVSIDNFRLQLTTEDLTHINGISSSTQAMIRNELDKNGKVIDEMIERVKIDDWEPVAITSTKINGLVFCITGKLAKSRKEIEDIVKSNGGLIAGVSKNLNYLITNDPTSGSGKNKKVAKLNSEGSDIKLITEQEFIDMVGA